jgi:hypothetical protein
MVRQTLNGIRGRYGVIMIRPLGGQTPSGGWPPSGRVLCFQLLLISNVFSYMVCLTVALALQSCLKLNPADRAVAERCSAFRSSNCGMSQFFA